MSDSQQEVKQVQQIKPRFKVLFALGRFVLHSYSEVFNHGVGGASEMVE